MGLADREPGADIGVRRHDDLVARSDPESEQGKTQRIEAAADAGAAARAAIRGEIGLEAGELLAKQVPAAFGDAPQRSVKVRARRLVSARKVEEGHRFARVHGLPMDCLNCW